MDALQVYLKAKGFDISPEFTGKVQRFNRSGELSGWFVGTRIKAQGALVEVANFGDWRTDEKYQWTGSDTQITDSQQLLIDEQLAELELTRIKERAKDWEVTAKKAKYLWSKREMKTFQTYADCKNIEDLGPWPVNDGSLMVPVMDWDEKIWGIQFIAPEGTKRFMKNTKIRGNFYAFENKEGKTNTPIVLCEGFSTGASIFIALKKKWPVVCGFNAGNLSAVGRLIREKCPSRELVIAGDDDRWVTRNNRQTGKKEPWNPGREKAERVLSELQVEGEGNDGGGESQQRVQVRLVLPSFKDLGTKPTDFNDLHGLEGLERVREQILDIPCRGQLLTESSDVKDPPRSETDIVDTKHKTPSVAKSQKKVNTDQKAKVGAPKKEDGALVSRPKKPTEASLVRAMLSKYEDSLIKDGDDLFQWSGTHWKRLFGQEIDYIKRGLQRLAGNKLKSGEIESCFRHFVLEVTHVPHGVSLFTPPPFMANFLNGTLKVDRGADGKMKKSFHLHDRRDYAINCIPLRYPRTPDETGRRNKEFDEMLKRIIGEDADGAGKIRAIKQLFGAVVFPFFPQFFLLYGPSGSGKSSIIIAAKRLISQDNWCSVEPHELKGFLMESMAGKLVNISTDIDITKVIQDGNVKKVIDRMPVRIDRKYQQAIYSPLPGVHIFGANDLPPSLDGKSGAHARRWSFIRLDRFKSSGGRHDFANWMFDQSPEGILNFALEGLDDLLEHEGHYFNPESGRRAMTEWQRESDIMGQFLDDLTSGDVMGLRRDPTLTHDDSALRGDMWDGFRQWCVDTDQKGLSGRRSPIARNKFYGELLERGEEIAKIRGEFKVLGVTVVVEKGQEF